jgi:hypothetical protein
MHSTLTTLVDRLDSSAVLGTDVIQWGSPIPSFGDLSTAKVATVGLNPSNREFVDEAGDELEGRSRRFHTLRSLGLASWSEVDSRHLNMILESCRSYFSVNPYDTWFKRLDQIVLGASASYYNGACGACHLDLIPYATACKWTELKTGQRTSLLNVAGDTLGLLLANSPVRVLLLNGRSVVEHFQYIAGVNLDSKEMPSWSLRRRSRCDVLGIAYKGIVNRLSGIELGRDVLILGFNHNIQSSFGVTSEVIRSIRSWIAQALEEDVR